MSKLTVIALHEIDELREFILFWGEMGTQWGLDRPVGQVHAMLYLSEDPLTAGQIGFELGLDDGDVARALDELQTFDIVRLADVEGDARDHYIAETDLWQLFLNIAAERKTREIDPVLNRLSELREKLDGRSDIPIRARYRINSLHEFTRNMADWYEQMHRLNKPVLMALMKMGSHVVRFIPAEESEEQA